MEGKEEERKKDHKFARKWQWQGRHSSSKNEFSPAQHRVASYANSEIKSEFCVLLVVFTKVYTCILKNSYIPS
jgi:hypothetical protein